MVAIDFHGVLDVICEVLLDVLQQLVSLDIHQGHRVWI
jgi:hypothetical protein